MNSIESSKKPAVKLQDLESKKSTKSAEKPADSSSKDAEEEDHDEDDDTKVIKNSAESMANDAEKLTDLITKSMMGQDLAERRAKDNAKDAQAGQVDLNQSIQQAMSGDNYSLTDQVKNLDKLIGT